MGAPGSTTTHCDPLTRGAIGTTKTGAHKHKQLSRIRANSKNGTVTTFDKFLERMIQLRNFLGAADAIEGEGDEA